MTRFSRSFILVFAASVALAACQMSPKLEEAQYWQRKDATSSLYMRGPKAQQTLHQDIATCVTDLDELERLGPLRETMPADTDNGKIRDPNSPEGKMAKWDSPKRDGYLYAEHQNYHDFEGCMASKGWERVANLPYEQLDRSRNDYLENVYGYHYQTNYGDKPVQKEIYNNSNTTSTNGMVVNE